MSKIYFVKELLKYKQIQDIIIDGSLLKELCNVGGFQNDSFRMVGIYEANNNDIVYCCPKYISDHLIGLANNGDTNTINELKNHLILIVKVLEKLRADNKNIEEINYEFSLFRINTKKRRINRYHLAKAIVTDYLENGIYFRNEKEVKTSGRGKVCWGLTMRKLEPIISDGEIFYPRLLRRNDYKNYDREITEIHKNIVLQCIEYLQLLGEKTSIEKPDIVVKMKQSNMYQVTPYIKQCLMISYTNREIHLFKAMISWCEESPFYKGRGCTTCFQNVWEWVNDSVWGTEQKESLKSSQPTYCLEKNYYSGGGDAEPDTLAYIKKDEQNKYIALFDSKYYVPKKNIDSSDKSIQGLPENREIVKQVAYLNDIRESCGNDIQYSNVFLLPECDMYNEILNNEQENEQKIWKFIGVAKKGTFDALRSKLNITNTGSNKNGDYVGVALVSPEKLYEQYLGKGKIDYQEIIKISDQYQKSK